MTDAYLSTPRRRVLLALLIVGALLNYADRQIIAILKPLIEVDFHWTDADYGHLASAFQLAAAVGLLFAGWFVDRVGIKWANPISVGLWSAIAMLQALAATLFQFAALRIALGAAEALGTPVVVKSIAILFPPKDRSIAFGGMNAASTTGAIVTPLFVPVMAALLGWRLAFLIVGGTGILWVVVWVMTARPVAFTPAPVGTSPVSRVSWRSALTDRRTWGIVGAKVLSDQVWWFLLFWAPDLLRRLYHLNVTQTSIPLAVIYSCAALGSIIGGLASRQLLLSGMTLNVARKSVLLACALLALPLAFVPSTHHEWVTVGLLGLTLAAHQGFSVNLFALIADVIPVARLATVTGIGSFSGNLGGMGILAFTGWILTRTGSYGPVVLFAGGSYLWALLWIQLFIPVLRVAAPQEA
jgi:MFS transporter, ACS family, hexuronate transporter